MAVRTRPVEGTDTGRPDYTSPVLGPFTVQSRTERRSTVSNDDGIVAPTAPPLQFDGNEFIGKFFPRGMRGKIEEIQIYCIRTAAGTIDLRYGINPGLGPNNTVTITPGAAWGWATIAIEEMWDYDSLFLWFFDVSADVSWGYDTNPPNDGHESADLAVTWANLAIRPFIRIVYSSETAGDIPISGIVNNIEIPKTSSQLEFADIPVPQNVVTDAVDIAGVGICELIIARVNAAASSDNTFVAVECDDIQAFEFTYWGLNLSGIMAATPGVSLTAFGVDQLCAMVITKKFQFKRRLRIRLENLLGPQTVTVWAHPDLIR